MDRHLLTGAILLLIVETVVLLADLRVIPQPFGSRSNGESQVIGEILSVQQDVKKRPRGSIIWEAGSKKEPLYAHDSLLTLDQSSAQLKLQNDISLEISENTLVVLEPTNENHSEEIRLRFSHGSMRSVTSAASLEVSNGDLNIRAQAGSSISIRSQGENLQVEVEQGSAEVSGEHLEKQEIMAGTRAKLSSHEIQKEILSKDLAFELKSPHRVYAHSFPVRVALSWKGEADSLQLTHPDGRREDLMVSGHSQALNLFTGGYALSLKGRSQSSSTIELQVLRADRIYYFHPLPRDRIALTEGPFSWAPIPSAESYEIQFSYDPDFLSLVKSENVQSTTFIYRPDEKGQFYWRVQAHDAGGFVIPALYSSPLYVVPDPLKAPKLHPPLLRTPAQDKEQKPSTSRIWNLLFPSAWAQEVHRSILFTWFPVPEADHYYIEISETADFREPLLSQRVENEEFEWLEYRKKIIYWRVAAGSDDGAMGLFSEAEKVDLSLLSEVGNLTPGVRIKRRIEEAPKAPPKEPTSVAAPPPTPEKPDLRKTVFGVWVSPVYEFLSLSAEEGLELSYKGFSPQRLRLQAEIPLKKKRELDLGFHWLHRSWKPVSEVPFQGTLEEDQVFLDVLFKNQTSKAFWGITVGTLGLPQRKGLESVELEPEWFYGFKFKSALEIFEGFLLVPEPFILYGSEIWHFGLDTQAEFEAFKVGSQNILTGIELNFSGFSATKGPTGFQGQLGLFLGFEF